MIDATGPKGAKHPAPSTRRARGLFAQMTPAQCRAARALADISRAELSGIAVVPCEVMEEFEAGGTVPSKDDLASIRRALEAAGVEFTNGAQPGVRLRGPGGTIPADQLNASNDE